MSEKKSGIKLVPPSKYIIQVKKIGRDTFSRGYSGVMSHEDPYFLGMQVVDLMGDCFAGEKNYDFQYELALHVLAHLNFDEKLLPAHLKEIRDKFDKLRKVKS